MKKKIFAFLMAAALMLSMLPTVAFAEPATATVTVASDADWKAFCDNAEANQDAVVNITADFNLGGNQFPEQFTGTLYGNGHTVTFGGSATKAMFADFAGVAYDLVLGNDDNSTDRLVPTTNMGAFACQVTADAVLCGLVNKVSVVTGTAATFVGGLIGEISGNGITVTLIDCQNACENTTEGVIAKKSTAGAGGLVGIVTGTTVSLTLKNCANNGKVNSASTQVVCIGGLVGNWASANGSLYFDRCVNDYEISDVKGAASGFLGKGPETADNNSFSVTFFKCANKGDIPSIAILKNSSQILCSSAGFISDTVAKSVVFDSCYNTGNLSVEYDVRDSYTGGSSEIFAAGFAVSVAATEFKIQNSYTSSALCSASGTSEKYVATLGCFTVESNDFTGEGNFDLSADGDALDKVAALENGTLYNADGRLVWETSKTLTTEHGAAIRTKTPTGLRFSTTISKAEYDALLASYKSVTVGTVIAPAAYVSAAGEFTMEALDTLGHSVNYLNVPGEAVEKGDSICFSGSVVEIKENHYQLDYAARGYLLLEDAEGNKTVIYADYEDSYFVRDVYTVADMALKDPDNGLSAEAVEVIQGIVDSVNELQ